MMRCFDGLVQADEYLNIYTYSLISQGSFDAESHFVAIWSIYRDKKKTHLNSLWGSFHVGVIEL